MPYLVRKIVKKNNLDNILESKDVNDIYADSIFSEFKTKENTLSTWEAKDKELIKTAILAIALTSSNIETMDFIILDKDCLKTYNLNTEYTDPGKIPLTNFQQNHVDIINLTLDSLRNLAQLYQNPLSCYCRVTKSELEKSIKDAFSNSLIDISCANPTLSPKLSSILN